MSQSKSFCVTINNYEDDCIDKIKTIEKITYAVFGKEIAPNTGTKHLQGYIQWKSKTRFATVKKAFEKIGLKPHIEIAHGNVEQNQTYCKKENDFTEWGEATKQGQRKDLERMYEMVVEEKASNCDIARELPATYMKYYKAVDRLRTDFAQEEGEKLIKKEFHKDKVKLEEWQEEAIDRLENQTDRQVLWVRDWKGNRGKTFLAKYIQANENAYYINGGRACDIAYGYNYQEYVIFDFTRSQEDNKTVNYSLIESFKNGLLFSPKYTSMTKVFKPPKIVCFSNFEPNVDMLSEDRWDRMNLD